MKTFLTPEDIRELPIHDARFISVKVNPESSGSLSVDVELEFHCDETLPAIIPSPAVALHFSNCWIVESNLLGYQTKSELIADWSILNDSAELSGLQRRGLARGVPLTHHKFEFSGGSHLNIVASQVAVTPLPSA